MISESTQRAQPLEENEGGHNAMKGFTYLTESSVAIKSFLGTRDRQKNLGWRDGARESMAFAVGMSLVLILSLLAVLLTQSVAGAGDFSSQTVNPRGSHSGVRMQPGNPQLDSDRKPNVAGASVKIESHIGGLGMQRGMTLRDIDRVNAARPGNNSIILCGTNCRR
jgi:hypothetical protein